MHRYLEEALQYIKNFDLFFIKWIPSSQNKVADELARKAIYKINGGMSVKKEWIAPLALLFVSFIWGATFVVVQNAMSFVGPFTFNAIRFLFAGIILLFVQIIFSQKTSKQDIKQSSLAGLIVGFFYVLGIYYKHSAYSIQPLQKLVS